MSNNGDDEYDDLNEDEEVISASDQIDALEERVEELEFRLGKITHEMLTWNGLLWQGLCFFIGVLIMIKLFNILGW